VGLDVIVQPGANLMCKLLNTLFRIVRLPLMHEFSQPAGNVGMVGFVRSNSFTVRHNNRNTAHEFILSGKTVKRQKNDFAQVIHRLPVTLTDALRGTGCAVRLRVVMLAQAFDMPHDVGQRLPQCSNTGHANDFVHVPMLMSG